MRLLRGDELEGQLHPQVRADDTADETAVDRGLKDAVSGLPSGEDDYVIEPYDASLELLRSGQVRVGVAADRYSTYLGGGVHMLWGDMLGNRRLAVDAQVNGGIEDIGAQVTTQMMRKPAPWTGSSDPAWEGILNLEVRVPLLGNSRYGLVNMPCLPTTVVAFLDGGVAWTQTDPPVWRLSDSVGGRVPVFSSGAAVRFNLLGALVAQVYYARPFQRPETKGQFGFVIAPGW